MHAVRGAWPDGTDDSGLDKKRVATIVSDLVMDVGMYDGADTAHYLSRGYRVVGIEANPQLVAMCRERFAHEIATGRLTVLNVGVASTRGECAFWLCAQDAGSSSFDRARVCARDPDARSIVVPCLPFADVLREHGVPHYLKVDIEGRDRLCLDALSAEVLPKYLSWEAGSEAFSTLGLVRELGFTRFKCISQTSFRPVGYADTLRFRVRRKARLALRLRPEPAFQPCASWSFAPSHSSGPFGEEAAGPWLDYSEVCGAWDTLVQRHPDLADRGGWYDFHARLD